MVVTLRYIRRIPMTRYLLPVMLLGALAASGCYSEEAGVGYSYGYAAPAPTLAYVAPGVEVIADYDYPVFYSDGFYWRYDGGLWYRSGYYDRGWVGVREVPYGIRGVQQPWTYSHYRVGATYNNGRWQGGRSVNTGYARDHRSYNPGYRSAPVYRGPSRGPVVRDHRR
jgi:hypothetical protein